MALVDGKLQGVVAGGATALAGEAGVPRLQTGRVEGGGANARLKKYGVDMRSTKTVEDVAKLLLLALYRLRGGGFHAWPVKALQRGEPHGADFMLRYLAQGAQGREQEGQHQNRCSIHGSFHILFNAKIRLSLQMAKSFHNNVENGFRSSVNSAGDDVKNMKNHTKMK